MTLIYIFQGTSITKLYLKTLTAYVEWFQNDFQWIIVNDMEFSYKIENQKGFKSKTSKNYSSLCDLRRATLYYSL